MLFVVQFAVLFCLLVVAFAAGVGVFAAVGAGSGGEPGSGLGAAAGGVLVMGAVLLLALRSR